MGGDHSHDHRTARGAGRKRLAWTLVLVVFYMGAEVVGGLLTNSLALLADAGHMLSDAASLALALFAMWIAVRPPSARRTYGYYRAEILAALVNGSTLLLVAGYIFWEAYHRLQTSPEVAGPGVIAVASGGLLVNLVGLWLLHGSKDHNLNLRGAWLHVLGDAAGSVGAIVAGALIWGFGWVWADTLASVLIGVLVLFSGWNVVRESVAVLMESVPANIDLDEVRETLHLVTGVREVQDLHVWEITSGMVALSVHVGVGRLDEFPPVLEAIREQLAERYGIRHLTVQPEVEGQQEPAAHT